jgi:hypothetical protein
MAGEEAGKLEEAFDNICRDSGESVVSLLSKVQPVFFRIVAMSVMISIYGTIQALAFLRR